MIITEPATLITDYLLAMFTGILASRLRRGWRDARADGEWDIARWRWWLSMAFAGTAVAGAAGGTVHGFQRALARQWLDVLWIATLESLVAAAFAVICAAMVIAAISERARRIAMFAAALGFIAYGVTVLRNPVFLAAIVAYGVAFGVLVAVRLSVGPLNADGRLLLAGVAFSVAAAVIQQSGWSPHRSFNHNDLYHVVQAVGLWLLYRAAMASERHVQEM